MNKTREFDVVFEKLAEIGNESLENASYVSDVREIARETDAIAELRRIVLETTEGDPKSYTSS